MTFTRHAIWGFGIGAVAGVVGAAYIGGVAERGSRRDHLGALGLLAPAAGLLLGGGPAGAAAGATLYGTKRSIQWFATKPRSVQLAACAVAGTAIATATAYKLGLGKD